MTNLNDTILERKKKKLNNIIHGVVNHLNDRTKRQSLTSTLNKDLYDIDFLKDKIAIAKKKIECTVPEIEKLQPGLTESQNKLSFLMSNKRKLSEKYEKSIADAEENKGGLSALKTRIKKSRIKAGELTAVLSQVKKEHENNASDMKALEKEKKKIDQKIMMLNIEIPVMKTTMQMMQGTIPESIDTEIADALVIGNVEESLKEYTDEMNAEIDKIDKIKQTIDEYDKKFLQAYVEFQKILKEKDVLLEKIKGLKNAVGNIKDSEKILDEIESMEHEIQQSTEKKESAQSNIENISLELKDLKKSMEKENDKQTQLNNEYTVLNELKDKMDMIGDMKKELKNFTDLSDKDETATDVNNGIKDIVKMVRSEINDVNSDLTAAINKYNDRMDGFLKFVDGLVE